MTEPFSALAFLIVAGWVVAASAVGAETALQVLDPLRLRELLDRSPQGKRHLRWLDRSALAYLSRLVSLRVMAEIAAISGTVFLARSLGSGLGATTSDLWGGGLGGVLLVMTETLGTVLGRRHPEWFLQTLAWPLNLSLSVVGWLGALAAESIVHALARWGPALVRGEGWMALAVSREDLHLLFQRAARSGTVELSEGSMLRGILATQTQTVGDVMTPAESIVSAREDTSLDDLVETIAQSGFTRIPLHRGNLDELVGIVHATDLFRFRDPERRVPLEAVRQPPRVPENTALPSMLTRFQASQTHLALVTAEGSPSIVGLVTMEDILEAVVGEIEDEHDPRDNPIQKLSRDTYVIDASVGVQELREALRLSLPEGDYDTLGGFLLSLFRRIPAAGEEWILEDVHLSVLEADSQKITRVRARLLR